jgi:hypothetical protein
MNLLQTVEDHVRVGLALGLDLKAIRARTDHSPFERRIARENLVYRY